MALIAGKNSSVVGTKDTTLVLRGSSIKIQWGNKFIDLIKNGKIACESENILKVIDSADNIEKDGLYLVNSEEVWLSIEGNKVLLSDSENAYVSFLVKQEEITAEQKQTALTNAGLYYNTLEEAQAAGIAAGMVYILDENKIYIVVNGQLQEYTISQPIQDQESEEPVITDVTIDGETITISIDGEPYISCKDEKIFMHKPVILSDYIQSENYISGKTGYKLHTNYLGQSILEIDTLIERSAKDTAELLTIYSKHNNYVTSTEYTEGQLLCYLKYPNKYQVGDTIVTQIEASISDDYTDGTLIIYVQPTLSQDVSVTVEYNNTQQEITIPAGEDSISVSNITDDYYIIDSSFSSIMSFEVIEADDESITLKTDDSYELSYIYDGGNPYIQIKDNNLEVWENGHCYTRLGEVNEDSLNLSCDDSINPVMGLYTHNLIAVVPKLYDTEFKSRCGLPSKYAEDINIPEESDDSTIVTSFWVNKKIDLALEEIKERLDILEDFVFNPWSDY